MARKKNATTSGQAKLSYWYDLEFARSSNLPTLPNVKASFTNVDERPISRRIVRYEIERQGDDRDVRLHDTSPQASEHQLAADLARYEEIASNQLREDLGDDWDSRRVEMADIYKALWLGLEFEVPDWYNEIHPVVREVLIDMHLILVYADQIRAAIAMGNYLYAVNRAIDLGEAWALVHSHLYEEYTGRGIKSHRNTKKGGKENKRPDEMTRDLVQEIRAAVDKAKAETPHLDPFVQAAKKVRYPEKVYSDGKSFPKAGLTMSARTIRRHYDAATDD